MRLQGLLVTCLLAIPAIPAVAAQEAQDMQSCVKIEDATERLACFDEVAARSASQPPVKASQPTPAETAQNPAPAAAQETPKQRQRRLFGLLPAARGPEEFGAEQVPSKTAKRDPDLERLEANIVSARLTAAGNFVVTLDNGQVWSQRNVKRPLKERHLDRLRTATITRAALGSYDMKIQPIDRQYKVRRIK